MDRGRLGAVLGTFSTSVTFALKLMTVNGGVVTACQIVRSRSNRLILMTMRRTMARRIGVMLSLLAEKAGTPILFDPGIAMPTPPQVILGCTL